MARFPEATPQLTSASGRQEMARPGDGDRLPKLGQWRRIPARATLRSVRRMRSKPDNTPMLTGGSVRRRSNLMVLAGIAFFIVGAAIVFFVSRNGSNDNNGSSSGSATV